MTTILKTAEVGKSLVAISQDKASALYIVTASECQGDYYSRTDRKAYGTLKQATARFNHLIRRITP